MMVSKSNSIQMIFQDLSLAQNEPSSVPTHAQMDAWGKELAMYLTARQLAFA
jgi:hypothetical protein